MHCSAKFCADSRPYMDCLVPHSDNSRWDTTAHSIQVPRSLAVPLPRLQAIQTELQLHLRMWTSSSWFSMLSKGFNRWGFESSPTRKTSKGQPDDSQFRRCSLAWGWDPFAGDILKPGGLSWCHRMILECRDGTFAVMDVALVAAVGELRRDIS